MATELTSDLPDDRAGASEGAVVRVPSGRHARRAFLLLGLAVFQFWLWGTRIVNLVRDREDFSAAFIAVHSVLYAAAISAGVILAVLGWRMWSEVRAARDRSQEQAAGVGDAGHTTDVGS